MLVKEALIFYMGLITFLCPNPDAASADSC